LPRALARGADDVHLASGEAAIRQTLSIRTVLIKLVRSIGQPASRQLAPFPAPGIHLESEMDQTNPGPSGRLRYAAAASRAEQFSIWALRLWWRAFPELHCGWADFLHGFRVLGVLPAVESCHRFCSVVLVPAGRESGLACLHFPLILAREEQLLAALSAASEGDSALSQRILSTFISPSAARVGAQHAAHYAQILSSAGLQWPTNEPVLPRAMLQDSHLLYPERLH
jgi:hypothetical protein